MTDNDNPWPYEDALDALIAAPKHHKLLLENDRVRVLETRIPAGDTTPIHTHRWPSVYYIVSWSHFLRTDGQGRKMVDSREVESLTDPPSVQWGDSLPPHALENVGNTDLVLISVELKQANS